MFFGFWADLGAGIGKIMQKQVRASEEVRKIIIKKPEHHSLKCPEACTF